MKISSIPSSPYFFAEVKEDKYYGESLGTVFETQASQLWLVVARGNTETIPPLTLGTAEESLFSEIKTGGNGEPIRKSNVEHKNILSFALYVKHYHEKNLIDDRRILLSLL